MGELALREREALLRLGCFRDLNTTQLEDFVTDRAKLKPHSRFIAVQRSLTRLKAQGLIAETPRLLGGPGGGSARVVYHLTQKGYRLAQALDPSKPGHRPPPHSAMFIEHALMTADVAIAFIAEARKHPGHQMSEWEQDWQAAERLCSRAVVPDGYFVYATLEWEIHAFVEVDLGTESPSRFAQKVPAYVAAYRSGSWRAQLPAWPLVLTVAPTIARATALRRASEDALRRERHPERLARATEFDFAALPDLRGPHGPLGPIWQIAERSALHPLIPADDRSDEPRGTSSMTGPEAA
jgi:hypothetical protein